MATTSWPKTLQQAVRYFTDPKVCLEAAIAFRWGGGPVTCPTCGSTDVHFIATRSIWRCKGAIHAKQQFSVRIGTIMEDSPIGLDKWMVALWLITNAKNGISSYELHRAIGITQKSAWFLLHRIRLAMQDGRTGGKLGGEVEADETFIGGKARNMHASKRKRLGISQSRSMIGKVAVMGLLQRGAKGQSRVRTEVISNRKRNQLRKTIDANVERGSTLYTDALKSYDRMGEQGYIHNVIDHAEMYADGQVHTNGLENFWSLFKRSIKGTYISIEPFHLFRYLDEQAYRFNNRDLNDSERFVQAAKAIIGRRLTYKALTGHNLSESPAF